MNKYRVADTVLTILVVVIAIAAVVAAVVFTVHWVASHEEPENRTYENVRIYRDKKNKTNRLNNCEQANIDKVFLTANEQLRQIEIIEENGGVMLLDDKTKIALEYRKKYPEASLKELAEIISLETSRPLTKSGISHRMRKIKELAEKLEKSKETY